MATTSLQTERLTYEEYLREFATEPPTMRPCEILDGERLYMPSPTLRHQEIVENLSSLFAPRRASRRLRTAVSPMDLLIHPFPLRVRQPDYMVFSWEQARRIGGSERKGPISVPPELVVEILSESDTPARLSDKLADYCLLGVIECWLVNPEAETVEQLRLTPQGAERAGLFASTETFASLAFPDITIAVADLFAG